MTYLITFAYYGCHLHGHESGSVDRGHNRLGSGLLGPDPKRVFAERERMDQPPYSLDAARREAVLASLRQRCSQHSWMLFAAHVRSNHVHVVVEADTRPERVMNDLKSYASRQLNRLGLDERTRKRWARHGSTRWLWEREAVSAAIRYVIDEQGEPMAAFEVVQA